MSSAPRWPQTAEEMIAAQLALAASDPPLWRPVAPAAVQVGSAWVCFERGRPGPGAAGHQAWAAAVSMRGRQVTDRTLLSGQAGSGYVPGLLGLRVGSLLLAAISHLVRRPHVLILDATGRDHPRRAGLAAHLGAILDLPTVGVTHRPLVASGDWPSDATDAAAPLTLDGEIVGYWVRTRVGRRPIAVHAAWRTDAATAVEIVLACKGRMRTPAPLRRARQVAREARARHEDGAR
jgi:deoxyribonuclease V